MIKEETTKEKKEIHELKAKFSQMRPADIAEEFENLTSNQRVRAIHLLDKSTLAEVFSEFDTQMSEEILAELTEKKLKELLQEMDSDDLVDFLQEIPIKTAKRLLTYIDEDKRKKINKLLRYPEETVGSLMSVDFVVVKENSTKKEVLEKIKLSSAGYEHLIAIYIVDDDGKLKGYVHLADILKIENDEDVIKSKINYDIVSVTTMTDQEEAANYFNKYHTLALPVTDLEDKLLGIITADDIFEVIAEEIHEDYTLMQGLKVNKEGYLESSPWQLAKQRVFWLLFLMISATFTGKIIQAYDELMSASIILAAYIPMLMDSGGNSGSQSSTIIIRALALDEIEANDFLKVIIKEGTVGIIVGFIVAAINYVRIIVFDKTGAEIALTVSITLFFTILISKLIGGTLPLLAKLTKQDPAVMASPLITTIVDAVSLIIYFIVASSLINIG